MEINIPDVWDKKIYNKFINELINNKDVKYKDFNSNLIPHTNNKIIGIRIPDLRNIAKCIYEGNYEEFLSVVKDDYMEEILIEGFVIGLIKDQTIADIHIKRFLPKIDNWCVCVIHFVVV